ncbi:hypothetical protein BASA81_001420 [Batrachochytrium salamandrivorans]|nr:hypothetical protein BASA81_001420 [Batrachochytrium salamandrivorans]
MEKRKSRLGWKSMVPLHVLVFALSLSISQPMQLCSTEVAGILAKSSLKASLCMEQHHIDFEHDLQAFRQSRLEWHTGFDSLLNDVAGDYQSLISDEGYTGQCQNRYPAMIFVANSAFLLALVCTFGYFIFQDATTSFGASQTEIYVALNVLWLLIIVLGVFTYPAMHLMKVAVKLSVTLEQCVLELKQLQRQVITQRMDLDLYNLHATIWDGVSFGVREPVFNYVVDKDFALWMVRRVQFLATASLCIVVFLFYRSNVKSLLQWRKAIPSVVCIGVTFPGSKDPHKLWRVGSGCIVSSRRGLILTNWHLFQRMGVDAAAEEPHPDSHQFDNWSTGSATGFPSSRQLPNHQQPYAGFAYKQSSSEDAMDSMRRSIQHVRESESPSLWRQSSAASSSSTAPMQEMPMDEDEDDGNEEEDNGYEMDEYGVPLGRRLPAHSSSAPALMQTTPPLPPTLANAAVHRHLVHSNQYAESLQETFPEMKIYIGTATRGHPHWQYEADFTSVESPSSEFTPFGLDLLLLKITRKVCFQGLNFSEAGPSASESMHAFTYSFDAVNTVQEGENFKLMAEGLVKLKIGNPFKLFPTDKLRLLGFPASGGYSLSVLTTYFTSMSFDYPKHLRGAWVNVNTQLPSGGSGGAAVNAQGHLVGIATQTKGELTNIRSITEATHLIQKAKREVDRERAGDKKRSIFISPVSGCSFPMRQSLFI